MNFSTDMEENPGGVDFNVSTDIQKGGFAMGKYDDIIHLPHHVSTKHPPMPLQARAAQFSPFAALSGHGDCIQEAGRLTDAWVELGEDAVEDLDRKLRELKEREIARILYFSPDTKKQGGAYLEHKGRVKRVDLVAGKIVFYGGIEILIERIFDVELIR